MQTAGSLVRSLLGGDWGLMNKGGFSWKRAVGLSAAKSRVSRAIGVPLTKSGRQRKVGRIVTGGGCILPLLIAALLALALTLAGCTGATETTSSQMEAIAGTPVTNAAIDTAAAQVDAGESAQAAADAAAAQAAADAAAAQAAADAAAQAAAEAAAAQSAAQAAAARSAPVSGGATVYITKTGEKYHKSGCGYLSQSRIPISLSDAQASGYGP